MTRKHDTHPYESPYKWKTPVSDLSMEVYRKKYQYLIENFILEKLFCTARANRPILCPGSTKSGYTTSINNFLYQNQMWSTEISAFSLQKKRSSSNNFFQRKFSKNLYLSMFHLYTVDDARSNFFLFFFCLKIKKN